MGWSSDDRAGTRRHEADARHGVMGRIGYRGRLDDDGQPLDGPGAGVGPFQAGSRLQDRAVGHLQALIDEAGQAAMIDGGYQFSGHDDDDPNDAWPRGYRRDREGR
jgi:hypothetical protein